MSQRVPSGMRAAAGSLCLAALLGACGAHSDYDRGPTKPPLEKMNLIVTKESPTEMSRLGEPVRVPQLDSAGGVLGPDQQRPLGDSARVVRVDATKKGAS